MLVNVKNTKIHEVLAVIYLSLLVLLRVATEHSIARSAIQQCDLFPYFHVVYMQVIISVFINLSSAFLSVKRGS